MKLARYTEAGVPRLGVVEKDAVIDLTLLNERGLAMRDVIMGGDTSLRDVREARDLSTRSINLSDVGLIAPVDRPGKYLAIGMNYAKHLEEADKLGVARAEYQTWFNKQTSCLSGPYDDIEPGVTEKLDYEVELVAIVGEEAKGVAAQDAHKHVFGYCVGNDVSARDWQFHTPTFTMGKSFDTHGPIGPWIVTADEIENPHDLRLRSWVNGELRQDNNTGNMLHDLWEQIAYLSTAFTLEPGDLIATGTPEGVGIGMDPPVFLQAGDVVRCEVEKIGAIENRVAAN